MGFLFLLKNKFQKKAICICIKIIFILKYGSHTNMRQNYTQAESINIFSFISGISLGAMFTLYKNNTIMFKLLEIICGIF